jgi:hypothetical protein
LNLGTGIFKTAALCEYEDERKSDNVCY